MVGFAVAVTVAAAVGTCGDLGVAVGGGGGGGAAA